MYLNEFSENTTFRFGTLELVRSDWRKYQLSLDEEVNNDNDITSLNI
jgi:cell surface protein SprA